MSDLLKNLHATPRDARQKIQQRAELAVTRCDLLAAKSLRIMIPEWLWAAAEIEAFRTRVETSRGRVEVEGYGGTETQIVCAVGLVPAERIGGAA